MNRKGFTLVEMAIVLVIIGALVAVAVKGKYVIESSKIYSDMNKIKNIQAAVSSYGLAVQGNFPDGFNYNTLNASFYTNPNDYTLQTSASNLTLFQARPLKTNNIVEQSDRFIYYEGSGDVIGIMAANLTADLNQYKGEALFRELLFSCNMDAILDDGIASQGMARIYNGVYNNQTNRRTTSTRRLLKGCEQFLAPITTSTNGSSNIIDTYGYMAIIIF